MFSASKTAGPSGYNINNSLRFRRSATAYLNRTPASAGNRKTFTYSAWIKRGLSGNNNFFNVNPNTGYSGFSLNFDLNVSGDIGVYQNTSGTNTLVVSTNALFRDFSAWYHVVVAIDTTQATAANRVLIYVNGVSQALTISTQVALNTDLYVNSTLPHFIGREQTASGGAVNYFDGYMAEINFIDGQALTPSSFGSTNATTGVWQPAKYTGSYGTNGFYLPFSDIGLTSGSNTGLGKDFSGNSNYWTTNNISVTAGTTYDAMTDSPTLTSATVANYATLNPNLRQTGTGQAPTSGNLKLTANTTGYSQVCCATIASTSGKFYWEVTVNGGYGGFGIADSNNSAFTSVVCTTSSVTANPGQYTWGWTIEISNGNKQNNNVSTSYGSAASSGDVYMCAVDIDNGKIWWGKNGTWFASGSPAAGTNAAFTNVSGNIIPYFSPTDAGGWTQDVNFGQRPFSYTPPTGFNRLNAFNLPTSTIVKGNTVMDATLYTGNNTGQTITNAGSFRPDFLWIKVRSNTYDNTLADSVRGVSAFLASNTTAAEGTNSELTSFNSNGFTLGATGSMARNVSGQTYVAWQWQAGQGTNTTNTAGSITSTVSVNATAGFSIVTYTGNGSSPVTIGHGLGVAPKFIIIKDRSVVSSWVVQHTSLGWTQGFLGITTAAASTSTLFSNNTAPTSSVFTVGGYSNNNAENYVAYCWAEIAGFSAFGSYTGNGSTDGTFVYTGFRPEFIMFKRTNDVSDWNILDTTRSPYNTSITRLFANVSNAENSSAGNYDIDILSNGFKQRNTNSSTASNSNLNGSTYIYMAFAENPFKNALAR